jgi:SAM-dependent methyltransferase
VYCSHVLEHVEDDRRAMAELFRILRPGGWAFLSVPIHGARTIEDPAIALPADRLRAFGQEDHVRIYGNDGAFERRLEHVGFNVRAEAYGATLSTDEQSRYGIDPAEYLFYCVRPAEVPTIDTKNDALREAAS